MKFKSRKDLLFQLILSGIIVLIIGVTYVSLTESNKSINFIVIAINVALIIFLVWIFFGTNYKLTKNRFYYKSGPIRGSIEIERITQIIAGKTMWVGLKPAMARRGIILKYEKYNEIYISPESNEEFIQEILKLKTNIEIIQN